MPVPYFLDYYSFVLRSECVISSLFFFFLNIAWLRYRREHEICLSVLKESLFPTYYLHLSLFYIFSLHCNFSDGTHILAHSVRRWDQYPVPANCSVSCPWGFHRPLPLPLYSYICFQVTPLAVQCLTSS